MRYTNQPDISTEFHLYRYLNGIRLIKPDARLKQANEYHTKYDTGHTVASLLQLPICIHFSDSIVTIRQLNEETASACGFVSQQAAIGKNLFSVFEKESAGQITCHNKVVMLKKQMQIFEESAIRQDGIHQKCLSIKLPWYDFNGEISGVLGCTIIEGGQPLASSLTTIASLGFLNIQNCNNEKSISGKQTLTSRQRDCLYYLTQGLATKEIAAILSLSPRTIDFYIITIKKKLSCQSRSDLIRKALLLNLVT